MISKLSLGPVQLPRKQKFNSHLNAELILLLLLCVLNKTVSLLNAPKQRVMSCLTKGIWSHRYSLFFYLFFLFLFLSPHCEVFIVLAKICPTRKKGYGQEFFVGILNSDITFFTFLLSEPDFDLNLVSFELSYPKKIRYRSSIYCLNFDIIRFVRPELKFLSALDFRFHKAISHEDSQHLVWIEHGRGLNALNCNTVGFVRCERGKTAQEYRWFKL